eukprot:g58325.t1
MVHGASQCGTPLHGQFTLFSGVVFATVALGGLARWGFDPRSYGLKYVAEDIFISWAHDHNIKVWDIKNRTIATLSAHKNDPRSALREIIQCCHPTTVAD